MTDFKLGKLAPKIDPRTLRLRAYLSLDAVLPALPASFDSADGVAEFPMYLNDREGCCTVAAAAHLEQIWSKFAGLHELPTDADVQTLYNRVNGGQDHGAVLLDVLQAWRSQGLGANKILGWAALDFRNLDHLKTAVWLFGGAYIGLALPLSAMEQAHANEPWSVVSDLQKAGYGSAGGHAVPIVAYTPDHLTCVTWGARKNLSLQFYETYCDESFVVLPSEWNTSGYHPMGLNMDDFKDDMDKISDE